MVKLISLSVVSLKVAEPIDTIKQGLTVELWQLRTQLNYYNPISLAAKGARFWLLRSVRKWLGT